MIEVPHHLRFDWMVDENGFVVLLDLCPNHKQPKERNSEKTRIFIFFQNAKLYKDLLVSQ